MLTLYSIYCVAQNASRTTLTSFTSIHSTGYSSRPPLWQYNRRGCLVLHEMLGYSHLYALSKQSVIKVFQVPGRWVVEWCVLVRSRVTMFTCIKKCVRVWCAKIVHHYQRFVMADAPPTNYPLNVPLDLYLAQGAVKLMHTFKGEKNLTVGEDRSAPAHAHNPDWCHPSPEPEIALLPLPHYCVQKIFKAYREQEPRGYLFAHIFLHMSTYAFLSTPSPLCLHANTHTVCNSLATTAAVCWWP